MRWSESGQETYVLAYLMIDRVIWGVVLGRVEGRSHFSFAVLTFNDGI